MHFLRRLFGTYGKRATPSVIHRAPLAHTAQDVSPDPTFSGNGANPEIADPQAPQQTIECGCLLQHSAFALATFDGQHRPCTIIASHCSNCQTMYQTVIIDGHVTRETLIDRSTRLSCPRSQAEQEFAGMIARAKQIGYSGDRLEHIMLPDLGKSTNVLPQEAAMQQSAGVASSSGNSEPLFGSSGGETGKVTYLRKRTQTGSLGTVTTYEEYTASSAEAARRFLLRKTVNEPAYYVVVETPEGVWGLDVEGLYLECLAPWQSDVSFAQVEGTTGSGLPSLFGLKQAAQGLIDNFIHTVVCGKCGSEWQDGLRYQAITVVQCPNCRTRNSVDSSRFTCIGR